MTPDSRYILFLAIALGAVNTGLAFTEQKDLGLYFAVNVIAYLVTGLLHVGLHRKVRRAVDAIGYVLFGGFLAVVAVKVAVILSGQ